MEEQKKNRGRRPYYRKRRNNGSGPSKENQKQGEPHPLFDSCIKLEMAIEAKPTEDNLATAFAICWNKYAWFEERESEAEAGSDAYKELCEKTDEWCEEYHRTVEKMKTLLQYATDSTFALPEITEVMNRNGYEDVNGLWQKKKKQNNG